MDPEILIAIVVCCATFFGIFAALGARIQINSEGVHRVTRALVSVGRGAWAIVSALITIAELVLVLGILVILNRWRDNIVGLVRFLKIW